MLPICLGRVLNPLNPKINPVPMNADNTAIGANITLCSLSNNDTDIIGASAPTIKNNDINIFTIFILLCFSDYFGII